MKKVNKSNEKERITYITFGLGLFLIVFLFMLLIFQPK